MFEPSRTIVCRPSDEVSELTSGPTEIGPSPPLTILVSGAGGGGAGTAFILSQRVLRKNVKYTSAESIMNDKVTMDGLKKILEIAKLQ